MRALQFPLAALLAMTAMTALAQTPPAVDPATGARPGHAVGVGASEPSSGAASNIRPADTRSPIAPTLPGSTLGPNASPRDYLGAARAALVAGRTGEAQQSLEMAETRALDRDVAPARANDPSSSRFVGQVHDALHALGGGDIPGAIAMIDLALGG